MKKELEIMKVRPEFKKCFKMSAYKNGFDKLSDYSSYVAEQMSKTDSDLATVLSNKTKEKSWKRYF